MGYGDSYSNNQFKWSKTITIVLYKNGVEVDRKGFPASLEGNGDQFKYFRDWEANGSEYTWKRL